MVDVADSLQGIIAIGIIVNQHVIVEEDDAPLEAAIRETKKPILDLCPISPTHLESVHGDTTFPSILAPLFRDFCRILA